MNKMVDDLGNPSLMVMDNWPINPSMVVICKHDVAEQITRPSTQFPYSVTRSDSASRVSELIGEHSILRKIVSYEGFNTLTLPTTLYYLLSITYINFLFQG